MSRTSRIVLWSILAWLPLALACAPLADVSVVRGQYSPYPEHGLIDPPLVVVAAKICWNVAVMLGSAFYLPAYLIASFIRSVDLTFALVVGQSLLLNVFLVGALGRATSPARLRHSRARPVAYSLLGVAYLGFCWLGLYWVDYVEHGDMHFGSADYIESGTALILPFETKLWAPKDLMMKLTTDFKGRCPSWIERDMERAAARDLILSWAEPETTICYSRLSGRIVMVASSTQGCHNILPGLYEASSELRAFLREEVTAGRLTPEDVIAAWNQCSRPVGTTPGTERIARFIEEKGLGARAQHGRQRRVFLRIEPKRSTWGWVSYR